MTHNHANFKSIVEEKKIEIKFKLNIYHKIKCVGPFKGILFFSLRINKIN